jgi:hypothetical protein
MVLILISCHSGTKENVGTDSKEIKNENLSLDTLEQLHFDYGLKAILCRNLKDKSKQIQFFKNDSLVKKILIPTSLDYSGFSLETMKQKGNYLALSTEHGTINYYQTNFYFSLTEMNPFALEKLQCKSFNKAEPDKWEEKDSLLSTPLPMLLFEMEDFLDNGW